MFENQRTRFITHFAKTNNIIMDKFENSWTLPTGDRCLIIDIANIKTNVDTVVLKVNDFIRRKVLYGTESFHILLTDLSSDQTLQTFTKSYSIYHNTYPDPFTNIYNIRCLHGSHILNAVSNQMIYVLATGYYILVKHKFNCLLVNM